MFPSILLRTGLKVGAVSVESGQLMWARGEEIDVVMMRSGEQEEKQLRKYLRQSKLAIPVVICFGLIALVILLLVDVFVNVRWWVYALCLWVVPFGLVGDGINIICVKRKLWRMKGREQKTPELIHDANKKKGTK